MPSDSKRYQVIQKVPHSLKFFIWGLCLFLCFFGLACSSSLPHLKPSRPSISLKYSHRVYALTEQIFSCDPQALSQVKSQNQSKIHLVTNALRLKKMHQMHPKQTQLWLDWLEAQAGLQFLRVDVHKYASLKALKTQELEHTYLQLSKVLSEMGRGFRKPPSYIWWMSRGRLNHEISQFKADSFSSTLLPSPWLELFDQQMNWLISPQVKTLDKQRCQTAITEIIQVARKPASQKESLSEYYEKTKQLGVRVVKGPRAKMSKGCLKLFGLEQYGSAEDELNQEGQAWHLILRPLFKSKQDRASHYLTLPIPHPALEIPIWDRSTKNVLNQLWAKRKLWWGAQGCWQELKRSDIASPINAKKHRWLHQSLTRSTNQTTQSVNIEKQTEWRLGSHKQLALNSVYSLAKEQDFKVPLSHRGVVQSVLEEGQLIVQRLSQPTLLALWTGERNKKQKPLISALLLGSLTPYILYEALQQLEEQAQVFKLAYEHKTLSASILVLAPWQKSSLKNTESHSLSRLFTFLTQAQKSLKAYDLLSTELSPVNAAQLSGEASLFEGDPKAILKEQLKRYQLRLASENLIMFTPGSTQLVALWPWFEPFTLKLQRPLEHLPNH